MKNTWMVLCLLGSFGCQSHGTQGSTQDIPDKHSDALIEEHGDDSQEQDTEKEVLEADQIEAEPSEDDNIEDNEIREHEL